MQWVWGKRPTKQTWAVQFYLLLPWFPSLTFHLSFHFYTLLKNMLSSCDSLQLPIRPVNPWSASPPALKLRLAKSQQPSCCSIQEQFFHSHVKNLLPSWALFYHPSLGFCPHCKYHIHSKTSQTTNTIQGQSGGWPYHPVFYFRFLCVHLSFYSLWDFHQFLSPTTLLLLPFLPHPTKAKNVSSLVWVLLDLSPRPIEAYAKAYTAI